MPTPIEITKRAGEIMPVASDHAHRLGMFISDGTLEHEEPKELATLFAEFVADYRPSPGIESELVRQLSMAAHRLRRLDRIETASLYNDATAHTRHEANVLISEAFDKSYLTTERIMKARAAAERSFNRVYKDLEARKANRPTVTVAPTRMEIEIDTRHKPAASTKRTQWVGVAEGATPTAKADTDAFCKTNPPR